MNWRSTQASLLVEHQLCDSAPLSSQRVNGLLSSSKRCKVEQRSTTCASKSIIMSQIRTETYSRATIYHYAQKEARVRKDGQRKCLFRKHCHLRTVRTRGSPFSLRLRSFSCRLLTFSLADTSVELSDVRPIMGAIKLLQILNTAYDGILSSSTLAQEKAGVKHTSR